MATKTKSSKSPFGAVFTKNPKKSNKENEVLPVTETETSEKPKIKRAKSMDKSNTNPISSGGGVGSGAGTGACHSSTLAETTNGSSTSYSLISTNPTTTNRPNQYRYSSTSNILPSGPPGTSNPLLLTSTNPSSGQYLRRSPSAPGVSSGVALNANLSSSNLVNSGSTNGSFGSISSLAPLPPQRTTSLVPRSARASTTVSPHDSFLGGEAGMKNGAGGSTFRKSLPASMNSDVISAPASTRKVMKGVPSEVEYEDLPSFRMSQLQQSSQQQQMTLSSSQQQVVTETNDVTEEELTCWDEKHAERRRKIIEELLETEKTYVESLKEFSSVWIPSLKSQTKLLKSDSLNDFINSIDPIIGISSQLLVDLSGSEPKGLPVGDIFLKMAPFFRMYRHYACKYNDVTSSIEKLRLKNPQFSKLLQELSKKTGIAIGMTHYMIMPIQRIPRYELLLRDLLNHTHKSHKDHKNLLEAVALLKEIADYINEFSQSLNSTERVVELGLTNVLAPARSFIKEGILTVEKQGEKKYCRFILFSDLLIRDETAASYPKTLNPKISKYPMYSTWTWSLKLCWIKEDNTFTNSNNPLNNLNLTPYKYPKDDTLFNPTLDFYLIGPDTWFKVTADSPEQRKEWIDLFRSNIQRNIDHNESWESRYGFFVFNKFGRYEGWWYNGLKHGQGVTMSYGSKYEGAYQMGKPEGRGTFLFPNGSKYVGEWHDGLMQGHGYFVDTLGSVYDGKWLQNKKHGRGKMTYTNGLTFEGDWNMDLISGYGKLVSNSFVIYEGEWQGNEFHGQGTFYKPSGKIYSGTWENGLRNGQGTVIYKDGSIYKGMWKMGKRHGKGTFDSRYKTRYQNHILSHACPPDETETANFTIQPQSGVDKHYLSQCQGGDDVVVNEIGNPNHNRYQCKCGFLSGEMGESKEEGYIYLGEWCDGVISGEGLMTYSDDASYNGQWKDGKYHGNGVFKYGKKDRSVYLQYCGDWYYGKKHGKGELDMANDNKFKGYFKDDKIHTGILTFPNGTKYEGRWTNNALEGKITIIPKKQDKTKTKKKKGKDKEGETFESLTDILNATVTTGEGTVEYGENKFYKVNHVQHFCNNLPILDLMGNTKMFLI